MVCVRDCTCARLRCLAVRLGNGGDVAVQAAMSGTDDVSHRMLGVSLGNAVT